MTSFKEQQTRLKELVAEVGFSANFRDLTSTIAFKYALLEEYKRKAQSHIWLEIASILESRGK